MADNAKEGRSRKRGVVTRYLKTLNRHVAEANIKAVKEYKAKSQQAFDELEELHFSYHDSLTSDEDIAASEQWFTLVETPYISRMREVVEFLATNNASTGSVSSSSDFVKLVNAPKV